MELCWAFLEFYIKKLMVYNYIIIDAYIHIYI